MVRMPRRCAVRMMRQAISPRLAMRTEGSMRDLGEHEGRAGVGRQGWFVTSMSSRGALEARPGMAARSSRRVGLDAHGDDAVGVADGLAALDLVDVLHAFHNLAPGRVLLVEEAGVVEADEELRIRRVRRLRARHGADAADVRLGIELGLEVRQVGAAGPGAVRAAGLGHEALDDAVEGDAVVEALAGKRLDALDVAGREVGA